LEGPGARRSAAGSALAAIGAPLPRHLAPALAAPLAEILLALHDAGAPLDDRAAAAAAAASASSFASSAAVSTTVFASSSSCTATACSARGLVENKRSTDVNSTQRARASVRA
jgi:hypothetical protein